MNRSSAYLLLAAIFLLALPYRSPAPLIFTPGEGWTYESVAAKGGWQRTRAKDQLDVAQQAFDNKDYNLTLKAARRVVAVWPLSDYAPAAEYLEGRYWEVKGVGEKAFKEYQKILAKYPKSTNYDEILTREYDISMQYYNGKFFRTFFGMLPLYPSMDKTAGMFGQIVTNGPYSSIAPQAQMMIGATREKQRNYTAAADAYELVADRYHDRPGVAADATYKEGMAYNKQAKTAEYDQGTAPGQNTFLAGDRHLIKRWGREIAIDGLEVFKAMLFELRAKFRHSRPSSSHERGQEMFPFVSPQCGKLHVYFRDRAGNS